jgi:hypothetical protein
VALVDHLKELRLDPEAISTDREVSAQLATVYANRARELQEKGLRDEAFFLAATEFRRAAAHSVLLSDWKVASGMFERAGDAYTEIGNPYGLMLYSCASDGDMRKLASGLNEPPADRVQGAYRVLATVAANFPLPHDLVADLTPSGNTPIGVLGLPVGAYIDLARSFYTEGNGWGRIAEATLPFLAAYSSAIMRAHESDYWDLVIVPFHPAEPDILSVLCCVEAVVRRRFQRRAAELIEQIPLNPVARTILHSILEDRFGKRQRQT